MLNKSYAIEVNEDGTLKDFRREDFTYCNDALSCFSNGNKYTRYLYHGNKKSYNAIKELTKQEIAYKTEKIIQLEQEIKNLRISNSEIFRRLDE